MLTTHPKDDMKGIGCCDHNAVETCSNCDKPIFHGDEYGVVDGKVYCEECLDVMPLCVLIPMCGGSWLKAGEE